MTTQTYTFDSNLRTRIKPVKAYRHFRNLMADKEDTTQVFEVINALNGNSYQKQFLKFANDPRGAKVLEANVYLPPLLDDHDALRELPEGTFGRAYLHFMETQNLTSQGLVDEYERFEGDFYDRFPTPMRSYSHRLRDTHDLLHVLTGYSRDALGELSVLAYSYAQHGGPGVAFISFMGAFEIAKGAPKGSPVRRAIYEGYRLGKAAEDIVYYDVMELLKQPLADVQAQLNVGTPHQYFAVHAAMRNQGIDPFEVIAAAQAA